MDRETSLLEFQLPAYHMGKFTFVCNFLYLWRDDGKGGGGERGGGKGRGEGERGEGGRRKRGKLWWRVRVTLVIMEESG